MSMPFLGTNPVSHGVMEPMTRQRREQLLECHPVLERAYTLPTPMLERTHAIVSQRIWTRRTGLVFYAPPRMGKTRCSQELERLINEEFPRAYVVLVSARRTLRASESHLFKQILEAKKHLLSTRRDAGLLLGNIKSDVTVKLSKTGGSQFVLLVDEAQKLSDTDFEQLLILHNSLDIARVRMTTIFFAQPEILNRHAMLLETGQRQIIARFLSEHIRFDGCCSESELEKLLNGYDLLSEYPEGTSCSYTRFFLPIAFVAYLRRSKRARNTFVH